MPPLLSTEKSTVVPEVSGLSKPRTREVAMVTLLVAGGVISLMHRQKSVGEDSARAPTVVTTPENVEQDAERLYLDVNGDKAVSPIDALIDINSLNNDGARTLTSEERHMDVNNDGKLTPKDPLLVIKAINDGVTTGIQNTDKTGT